MHANLNTNMLAANPDGQSAIQWLIDMVFPRRLHRMSYLVRGLLADVVVLSLYSNDTTMDPASWWSATIGVGDIGVAAFGVAVYTLFFIILPRMRDLEMSNWWLLAAFVPVVNIGFALILLFRPPQLHLGEPSGANEDRAAPVN